jgi:hypothetical protein
MDQESMKTLRFDKRLIRRRGWVSREEIERELETLPDVSHKIDSPEEKESQQERAAPSHLPETPDSETPPGRSEPGGF